jgi:predicted DNA-binding ribbon-helix-helix protein
MLMLKTRRLQVLLEEEQYRRLEAVAARRKVPVAVVVREALDDKLALRPARRRAAAEAILSAAPMAVGTPEELRAELEELRGGRR